MNTLFSALRKRQHEEGFTLIELMVVVLIIAILIAIAIPTFLGARKRAQDRAAQSNIRNAFTADKTVYTDAQKYASATDDFDASGTADLTEIEPSLAFQKTVDPPTATTGNSVFVDVDTSVTPNVLYIVAKSASGSCFYLKDDAATGTKYGKDTDGTCGAHAAPTGGYSSTPW